MPWGSLWALRQLFPQLLCQFGRITKFLIVNIDVLCDDGFNATANTVCSLRFFEPDRLKQLKDVARLDLRNLKIADRGIGIALKR